MVATAKALCGGAAGVAELTPAMQTHVPVRLESAAHLAHDEKGQGRHIVDEEVARLGNFLFTAHDLPGALPHLLDFLPVKLVGQVPLRRNPRQPEIG
jgi:hypothetical protein